MNFSDIYPMIIGGQIPGRTIEQNLTSEARDGFAMSRRSANGQTKDLKNIQNQPAMAGHYFQ
ncbi:hypothetical protein DERF_002664 [Dermatophagoides farinae]|uniref:Uncharacterized protein n=1 Tax=Dermatophagoides farinae TaxID=6954 RepID=A0A922LC56_DERFA|nr:hypothetical protein DERF_002664 [Dermatophagoides farinae]